MGHIIVIATVGFARGNHADWGLNFFFQHGVGLGRGGLGAEQKIAALEIIGILHIAGWVILWNVEELEVETVGFDVASFDDLITHVEEDVGDFVNDRVVRIDVADVLVLGWKGDVDRFLLESFGELLLLDFRALSLIGGGRGVSRIVDRFAE